MFNKVDLLTVFLTPNYEAGFLAANEAEPFPGKIIFFKTGNQAVMYLRDSEPTLLVTELGTIKDVNGRAVIEFMRLIKRLTHITLICIDAGKLDAANRNFLKEKEVELFENIKPNKIGRVLKRITEFYQNPLPKPVTPPPVVIPEKPPRKKAPEKTDEKP